MNLTFWVIMLMPEVCTHWKSRCKPPEISHNPNQQALWRFLDFTIGSYHTVLLSCDHYTPYLNVLYILLTYRHGLMTLSQLLPKWSNLSLKRHYWQTPSLMRPPVSWLTLLMWLLVLFCNSVLMDSSAHFHFSREFWRNWDTLQHLWSWVVGDLCSTSFISIMNKTYIFMFLIVCFPPEISCSSETDLARIPVNTCTIVSTHCFSVAISILILDMAKPD